MILCLCEGVPAETVTRAIGQGASTLADIRAACGAGADCGACHASLLDLLAMCTASAARRVVTHGTDQLILTT